MDCRTAERLISLQPEGQLTIEESIGLAVHVADCRACAREQQLQERLSRTLQEIGQTEMEAPVELGSLVLNRLRSERRNPLTYIPTTWRKTVAAAAALLLIAGGSAGVTAEIWRMAGGGKTVVLEPHPNAVGIDNSSGYTAPPGTTGQGAPDSDGTLNQVGDTPGSPLVAQPGEQKTGAESKATDPLSTASGQTGLPQRTAGVETTLLSGGMKVTSTVLKFAVEDMSSARARVVSIAAGFGATNQVFPEQSNGRPVLVMRLMTSAEQAPSLISNLGLVGTVVDRQDESRDLTTLYNETLVEYRDLLARHSTVQEPEEQRKLEVQAASYKQQLDNWSEEAGKRVIMVWLESE